MTFDEQVAALRPTATPRPCRKRKADCTPEEWAAFLEYNRQWYLRNRDTHRQACRKWMERHPAKTAEYSRRHYQKHAAKRRAASRAWQRTHRKHCAEYARRRRAANPAARVRAALSCRINQALRRAINGQGVKASTTDAYIGCTVQELMRHLESQFLPGMTWDNWGRGSGKWHIDHVVPFGAVDVTRDTHMRAVCRYTNLRPAWCSDNVAKGKRIDSALIVKHFTGGTA